jgi:hypothetical protein
VNAVSVFSRLRFLRPGHQERALADARRAGLITAAVAAAEPKPVETKAAEEERREIRAKEFAAFLTAMSDGSAEARYGTGAAPARSRPVLVSTAGDSFAAARAEQEEREAGGPWPEGAMPASANFITAAAARARGEEPADDDDPAEKDKARKARKKRAADDEEKKKKDDDQDGDDDEDTEDSEKARGARVRERSRIKAVLESESGQKFPIAARWLSFETTMPRGEVIALLNTMAQLAPPQQGAADLRTRSMVPPTPNIGSDGGRAPDATATVANFITRAYSRCVEPT